MCTLLLFVTTLVVGVISYVYYLLRSCDQPTAASSLDAFILPDTERKADKTTCKEQKSTRTYTVYTEKGRQILVLFATEYGFSEEIAGLLVQRLQKLSERGGQPWQPRALNAKHHRYIDWERETICFVVISTCGEGVAPRECGEFLTFLQSCAPRLHHLRVSVLALGDSNYPHFCRAGLRLAHRLEQLRAKSITPVTLVDGEDWGVIEGWMDVLCDWLEGSDAQQASPQLCVDYLDLAAIHESSKATFSRHNPFMATLKTKQLLTQVNDVMLDRETIHCELDVSGSGFLWSPGDSVAIYPTNNSASVAAVMSLLGVSGEETVQVLNAASRIQGEMTLREALLCCYDISKATPSTVSLLQQHITASQPGNISLSSLLTSKDGGEDRLTCMTLTQVLRACCGDACGWSPSLAWVRGLLQTLRPLQARYYSISSSVSVDDTSLSVTMAVVRFMLDGQQDGGVTTTHVQDRLQVGQQVPVFISPNPDFRLPADPRLPIILICAGTGLAPFRAFAQEREVTGTSGEIHLYFGCRHPDKDFLYQQQLESWAKRGLLQLRVAFSRYHHRKVYVQHLLTEDAALLWRLIHTAGAVVYVCGDAGQFAPGVHQTLLTIVQQQGQVSLQEAEHYLAGLQTAGHYLQDVWLT